MLRSWVENNHKKLFEITCKVSKDEYPQDLFQLCIEELLNNRKVNSIPDDQKFFYFAKIVKNQFNSKNSKYHKIYRKYQFIQLDTNMDIPQDEYEPPSITMDWVLDEVEKIRREQWYLGQLFLLYLSRGANLTKLSKLTNIPISNLSRDINLVKNMLKSKLEEKLK